MTSAPHFDSRILLVVATLGKRLGYLTETLQSIRAQSVPADVVMVAPPGNPALHELAGSFGARLVADPGSLAKAINLGMQEGLTQHEFVNWLNDDDLLEPGSLETTSNLLDVHPEAVVAFGSCRYIDEEGRELWISKAGSFAPRILKWGPDLIPQPGMLVRARDWLACGGLDESYQLAFDLDLLLRLKTRGRLIATPAIVSAFRWHADSLTVDGRSLNLAESERAKRQALGPVARRMSWIWERPMRLAIKLGASGVNRRAKRLSAEHESLGYSALKEI